MKKSREVQMKKIIFLILLSVFSIASNANNDVGSGSITFIGRIVETTCDTDKNGTVCGKPLFTGTDNALFTSANNGNDSPETSNRWINVLSKKHLNDTTLLATVLYL